VESLSIIEDFNVVGNILFGFVPCRIDGPVDPLVFQGCKKGFGERIVVTTSGAAQRLPDVQRGKFRGEFRRGVLGAMPLS
jgi:hypothetical protein